MLEKISDRDSARRGNEFIETLPYQKEAIEINE